MRRSEIFESFIKIAQDNGLISESEHAEHTEKDFHETNPRHDSLTIEQISKLYNTKSDLPKGMEYNKNIIENAHPEKVVLFMAHDKLNGLVENENEGQNIRIHISLKEPDGHLVQRKYAEKQLIMSLVRAANDLDNRNQEELRKLADVCLIQAVGFKKEALWPLVIGIAAAVGILYAKQHLRFHNDGFAVDYQKTISEIDDLLNANSNLGVGYSYTPAFIQVVEKLKEELTKLNASVQKIMPILEKIETPRTGEELKQLAAQPETQEAHQALTEFMKTVEEAYPFINQVVNNFNNEGYKQRAISQKGFLSSIVDSAEVLHGGGGLIADDFDDVKHALQTLKIDIDNIIKGLQTSENMQQSATQQLQATQDETTKLFQSTKPAEEESSGNTLTDLEEMAKGIPGI